MFPDAPASVSSHCYRIIAVIISTTQPRLYRLARILSAVAATFIHIAVCVEAIQSTILSASRCCPGQRASEVGSETPPTTIGIVLVSTVSDSVFPRYFTDYMVFGLIKQ